MTSQLDVATGRDIIARWCALAERRLEHLTELYETGRWRRFYTESAFLENVRETKSVVEVWRDLLSSEASRDNRPIDVSWLDRRAAVTLQGEIWCDPAHLAQVEDIARDAGRQGAIVLHDDVLDEAYVTAGEAAATATAPELDAVTRRYPLLHNRF